jgi:hypothetical protein
VFFQFIGVKQRFELNPLSLNVCEFHADVLDGLELLFFQLQGRHHLAQPLRLIFKESARNLAQLPAES